MGELTKVGWRRMDALVEAHGADDVLHMVCEQVADGATLSDISKREGIPYSVLWKWLGGDEARMGAYKSALEAKADLEAHRALEIADGATAEDVVVARLRTDVRKWLVGKWGKGMYGEGGVGGGGIGAINITISPLVADGGKVIDGEVV